MAVDRLNCLPGFPTQWTNFGLPLDLISLKCHSSSQGKVSQHTLSGTLAIQRELNNVHMMAE